MIVGRFWNLKKLKNTFWFKSLSFYFFNELIFVFFTLLWNYVWFILFALIVDIILKIFRIGFVTAQVCIELWLEFSFWNQIVLGVNVFIWLQSEFLFEFKIQPFCNAILMTTILVRLLLIIGRWRVTYFSSLSN